MKTNLPNAQKPNVLILIRHAESDRNKVKKGLSYFADEYTRNQVRGVPDHKIALTELGRSQAEATGKGIKQHFGVPDYIYHSGYTRTIQTTEGILKAYTDEEQSKIKIRQNIFLRERDSGFAYDMTEEEARKHFPWLKEYWETFGGFFARPPGGESLADVVNRAHTFMSIINQRSSGKKIFAVTHGGTIRCLRYVIEKWTHDRALAWPPGESPKNCSLTVYELDSPNNRLNLKEYNTVFWE